MYSSPWVLKPAVEVLRQLWVVQLRRTGWRLLLRGAMTSPVKNGLRTGANLESYCPQVKQALLV